MQMLPDDSKASDVAPMANATDFHPEVLRLFDKYVHCMIDRRAFLSGATRFAAAGMTAAGLLEALSPRFAYAQKVPKDDPRLKAETVQFESPKGSGKASGYLVRQDLGMEVGRLGHGRNIGSLAIVWQRLHAQSPSGLG